jgi:hypothetical protein
VQLVGHEFLEQFADDLGIETKCPERSFPDSGVPKGGPGCVHHPEKGAVRQDV